MQPRIEILKEKKLVGKRIKMSWADNKVFELWKSFMPSRKEISNNLTPDLFAMQVYDHSSGIENFNPETPFDYWAAIEVEDFSSVPEGLETFTLTKGMYVVFHYKGLPENAATTFQYIFGTWLPASVYVLDTRPHFALMGEKYKNNDPDSEEELWIPIKPKA